MSKNESLKRGAEISREQWDGHVKSWKKSGLSQSEYCRHQGIVYSQFLYWKKKLTTKATSHSSPIKFLRVSSPGSDELSPTNEPLNYSGEYYTFRLKVRDVYVEVRDNFSPMSLARVLQVLRSI